MKVIKEGSILVKDSVSGQPQTYNLGGKFVGDNIIGTDGEMCYFANLDEESNRIFVEQAVTQTPEDPALPSIVTVLVDSGLDWEHHVRITEEVNV